MMEQPAQFTSKFLTEFEILPWDPDPGSFGTLYKVKPKFEQQSSVPTVIKIVECFAAADFTVLYKHHQLNYPKYARREIDLLKNLQHPNIVTILDEWVELAPIGWRGYPKKRTPVRGTEGIFVIQTEYCDQGSLSQWLQSGWRCVGDGWKILYQIASALEFMHNQDSKIIHRDLKPANILLKTEGEHVVVKIADFGLATEIRTNMTSRVGTKSYRSPELCQPGGIKYSEKADIYSYGVVLFEVLVYCTKKPNLEHDFVSLTKTGVQEEHSLQEKWGLQPQEAQLIRDMVHKDPSLRPTSTQILSRLSSIKSQYTPSSVSEDEDKSM